MTEQLNIQPLTATDIDLRAFEDRYDPPLKPRDMETAWAVDFADSAWLIIANRQRVTGNPIDVRKSDAVEKWLRKTRPAPLFFDPDPVMAAAQQNSRLVVEKEEGETTVWRFKPNLNVFPHKWATPGRFYTRGRPLGVRNYPYVIVQYVAEVANGKVIFKPDIEGGANTNLLLREVDQELITLLGVQNVATQRQLELKTEVGHFKTLYVDLKR